MPDIGRDVEACLLDEDGSARDLNFESPTWSGIEKLIRDLQDDFSEVEVHDDGGNKVPAVDVAAALRRIRDQDGYVHMSLRGGRALVSHLQLFVGYTDSPFPFVELTFFPDDVVRSVSLEAQFLAWLEQIQRTLQAKRAYARYENATWKLGEVGARSGVFYSTEPSEGSDE